jgi:cobalt-zinc-cadmium efflux system membrane fusion protein
MMHPHSTAQSRLHSLSLVLCLALSAAYLGACSQSEHEDHEDHEAEHDEHEAEHDEHEADQDSHGVVELTASQLSAAGVEVLEVGPGEILEQLTLSAVVAANMDAVQHVNPRVPGIIISIEKHLGEQVEKGDLLCTLASVDLGAAAAECLRAKALVSSAEKSLEQSRALFELRIDTSTRVMDGAVASNQAIFDLEQELQAKGVSTVRPLIEAERTLKNSILERERVLTDLAAKRDEKLLESMVDLREKRILATASENRLLALGVEPAGLNQSSDLVRGIYRIHAAQQGIVSARHITPGEFVDGMSELYTIQDLSSVWIVASAYETDLRHIRVGQRAFVHLNAFPDLQLWGEVSMVEYEIDRATRAVGVRIELDNQQLDSWPEQFPLRPGMFGRAEVVTSRRQAEVCVPESAIVHGDDGDAVFVETAKGVFERRAVKVRGGIHAVVEVLVGLKAGDRIAASRTFMLKSIERQAELGGGHSH